MLLAIDIGNTSTNFGVFRKSGLMFNKRIPTRLLSNRRVGRLLVGQEIAQVIVCSVVPDATKKIKPIIRKLLGFSPIIVGKDIKAPIRNLYKKPSQVGQDRLVNAVAGLYFYGKPLIIVDFGTAITFDLVTKKGAYAGGAIVPGIEISLETLAKKAALLPKITPKPVRVLIGRDTVTSIRSGVTYGIASLCDGMVQRIRTKYGAGIKAVATGGNARFICRLTNSIDIVDPSLTLKGLRLIYLHANALVWG